jgi:hypothetical protein
VAGAPQTDIRIDHEGNGASPASHPVETTSIRLNAFAKRWEHYRRKREHYGLDHPDFYESDLRNLFRRSRYPAPVCRPFLDGFERTAPPWPASRTPTIHTIEQLIQKIIELPGAEFD